MPSGMTAAEVSSSGSRKPASASVTTEIAWPVPGREDHHVGGVARLQLGRDLRVVGVGGVGDHLDLDAGLFGVLRRHLRVVVVGVVRLGDHDREAASVARRPRCCRRRRCRRNRNSRRGPGHRRRVPREATTGGAGRCVLWHFEPFVTSLSPAVQLARLAGRIIHLAPFASFRHNGCLYAAIGAADPRRSRGDQAISRSTSEPHRLRSSPRAAASPSVRTRSVIGAKMSPVGAAASAMRRLRHGFGDLHLEAVDARPSTAGETSTRNGGVHTMPQSCPLTSTRAMSPTTRTRATHERLARPRSGSTKSCR